jgi:hypothetical protein
VSLAAFRELRVLPRLHESLPKYLRTVWIQAGIGSVSILLLTRSFPADWYRLPFLVFTSVGLICLFAVLIKIFELDVNLTEASINLRISDIVKSITTRVTPMLLVLGFLFMFVFLPGSKISTVGILLAGSFKAVNWVLLFWIVRINP